MSSEPEVITDHQEAIRSAAAFMVEHLHEIGSPLTTGDELCGVPKHDALLLLIAMVRCIDPATMPVALDELERQVREHAVGKHRKLHRVLNNHGLAARGF